MSHSGFYPKRANFASFLTTNPDLRNEFANKVFLTITAQVVGVCAVNILCRLSATVSDLALSLRSLWAIAALGLFVAALAFRKSARKEPTNYYYLLLFVVSAGFSLYALTHRQPPEYVLRPAFYLALSVGVLAGLSCLTEVRFSSSVFVFYFFWAHLVFMLLAKWFLDGSVFVPYLVTLAFCLYTIYDLQSLVQRKSLDLRQDEHLFATAKSYTDVFSLFGGLLDLVQDREPTAE